MNIPALCIIQARQNSHRLPNKMLLKLGDETLIARGVRIATEAFGKENVIVAIPAGDEAGPLGDELRRIDATIEGPSVDEADVLSRFWHVAHKYRWHSDSVLVRHTPDDHMKSAPWLRRVAGGHRMPVELGGEAFTLAMLDAAHRRLHRPNAKPITMSQGQHYAWLDLVSDQREHITRAIFATEPPPAPPGCWTIDTEQDYIEAQRLIASGERK